jgi:hypothetical protein
MGEFDIYFSGRLLPDASEEAVRKTIGGLFKLQGAALDRLFSGEQVRIKTGVDVDLAGRYRAAFRDAGALIDIVPHGAPPPPPSGTTAAPPSGGDMQLLPPGTGSLEDCAPKIPPRPLPDTSGISLAMPGVDLDDTPPPPPAKIDISGLSMSGPDFSLEDCVFEREPRPIPDISHLELEPED